MTREDSWNAIRRHGSGCSDDHHGDELRVWRIGREHYAALQLWKRGMSKGEGGSEEAGGRRGLSATLGVVQAVQGRMMCD